MTTFPYPAAPSSGDWAVTLPGGSSIGEVLVYTGAPPLGTGTFNYTGSDQSFVVPAGVHTIRGSLWGAAGELIGSVYPGQPGNGGFLQAYIPVTPGETLTIQVPGVGVLAVGGWPDGGAGVHASAVYSGGGGGSARIKRGSTVLAIAGGGAGSGSGFPDNSPSRYVGDGGGGGYPLGQDGTVDTGGSGLATPGGGGGTSAGGLAGNGTSFANTAGHAGAALAGAAGVGQGFSIQCQSGGGGGGWFGGGSAGIGISNPGPRDYGLPGSGGGSSAVPGSGVTLITHASNLRTGNGMVVIDWGT